MVTSVLKLPLSSAVVLAIWVSPRSTATVSLAWQPAPATVTEPPGLTLDLDTVRGLGVGGYVCADAEVASSTSPRLTIAAAGPFRIADLLTAGERKSERFTCKKELAQQPRHANPSAPTEQGRAAQHPEGRFLRDYSGHPARTRSRVRVRSRSSGPDQLASVRSARAPPPAAA